MSIRGNLTPGGETTRRDFMLGCGAAALTLMLSGHGRAAAPGGAARRPNLVLCMTDDQGWGDVSYNGLEAIRTPALDEMAASGLRMDRFYAAAPVCSPTRGSVLTGRHPNRYGCFNWGRPLPHEELTLAAALKQAGYRTGHFGKWHLNGITGPGRPIAADDPYHPGRFGFDQWLSVSNYFETDPLFSRMGEETRLEGDGSDAIVVEALKFIDAARREDRPFLAVVWFGSPHVPHRPLPADLAAADGDAYYGELVAVDRAMGRLRSELRRMGIAEDTIVWFNSDNGAHRQGSNGGLRGMKGTLWEGGVRVPGIVEWPGRIRPMRTDVPASTSDIMPTMLEIVQLQPRGAVAPIDGVSLLPLFDGRMQQRPPMGFWHAPEVQPGQPLANEAGWCAWMGTQYKLHRRPEGEWELYDLLEDVAEERNLLPDRPQVAAGMREQLADWQRSVIRSLGGADYAPT